MLYANFIGYLTFEDEVSRISRNSGYLTPSDEAKYRGRIKTGPLTLSDCKIKLDREEFNTILWRRYLKYLQEVMVNEKILTYSKEQKLS